MKKIMLMAVAAMMATMSNAQGLDNEHEQGETTVQIRVGGTLSNLSGLEDTKSKLNITYGVEFEHFLADQFSLAGGVLFTDQGTKLENQVDNMKVNIYYAAFPITANYYILPGLAIKAGVQPAYRVKSRIEQGGTKIDYDRFVEVYFNNDKEVQMNKFDLSIPVGLSYEIKGFTLDARYNFGLTKVFSGLDDAVRNRAIIVTLGYKL